jgi:hypothetical protein
VAVSARLCDEKRASRLLCHRFFTSLSRHLSDPATMVPVVRAFRTYFRRVASLFGSRLSHQSNYRERLRQRRRYTLKAARSTALTSTLLSTMVASFALPWLTQLDVAAPLPVASEKRTSSSRSASRVGLARLALG